MCWSTGRICSNRNLKKKFKSPVKWKNIMLKVFHYQLILAKLKVQYSVSNKILLKFQDKMMRADSILLIIFKFIFETDFSNSFQFKKYSTWTVKKKLKLIHKLKSLNHYNLNEKDLEIRHKLIQKLLVFVCRPIIFVRKKLSYNVFCNRFQDFHVCVKILFSSQSYLNNFLVWNAYLKRCRKFILTFKQNLINLYSFQLLIYNQIINNLNLKILKNLLWFTIKVELAKKWIQKHKKSKIILGSKIYYLTRLKYNTIFFFHNFLIFFKSLLFVRLLINYKLRKLSLKSMVTWRINGSNNAIYKFFFNKQKKVIKKKIKTLFYTNHFTSQLILNANKFAWNLYKFLKPNMSKINWKKLNLYLTQACLKWINKKQISIKKYFNSFSSFWLKNLKFSKKCVHFINFKNFYL